MSISKRALSYFLSIIIIFTSLIFIAPRKIYAFGNIERIDGMDRYDTAIAVSEKGWISADNVVLVTGEDFPDALCAAPLAKKLNAPILLTEGADLKSSVLNRILELGARNVFIVGGTGVISGKIQQKLMDNGKNVKRLAGIDRYGTSLEVANYFAEKFGITGNIVVATGENYPDALSIAPAAAVSGMPILLTEKDNLPGGMTDFLKENSIVKAYIIGGRGVIGSSIEQQLPGPVRIWGSDRYETNALILEKFKGLLDYNTTYIATGENFPDALAGSALAPITSSPIILTAGMPDQFTTGILGLHYPDIKDMYILGGDGAVSNNTENILSASNINVSGNSLSNINNYGIASMQGGWIYYSNYSDNQRLYKMRADGSQNQLLLKDEINISNINTVGDWIYYSGDDGKVYRVRTDGSDKSLIIDDDVYFLYVLNNHIYYYSSGSLNDMDIKTNYTKRLLTSDDRWHYFISERDIYFTENGMLYKTDINGLNKSLIINDSVAEFNISENNIFYLTPGQKLFRTDLAGHGGTAVTDDNVANINTSGNYIYYLNASDNNSLYRIASDGSGGEKLGDYSVSGSINVSGNTAFCADLNVKTSIYGMDPDGINKSKLIDHTASYLVPSGDSIYYVNMQGDDMIYSLKDDGTMGKSLGVSSIGKMEVYDGFVYYCSSDDNALHSIKTDGSGDVKLNGISSVDFKLNDGFIYFSNLADNSKLYKAKLDGTGSVVVSDGSARNIMLYNGSIYYINDGDGASGYGIYAVSIDGTGSRLVESTYADSMMVSGDFLIYRGISDGRDEIVRERPDGSDKLVLAIDKVDYASNGEYVYTIDGTGNVITRYNPIDGTSRDFDVEGNVFSIIAGTGCVYYQINDSSLKLYQTPLW